MNYERRKQGYVASVGTPTGRKVAVIGMGPAGFGCADILVQKGHEVIVFESNAASGALLVYGTSNFKPAKDRWREKFERAGLKFVLKDDIGKNKTIDGLFEEGFDAVFIDVSSGIDMKMNDTPGIDLSGVYEATDFLIRANMESNRLSENMRKPLDIGRRVVVIGDGDTIPDCLRSALKLGSEDVTCLCQHSEEVSTEEKGQKIVRVERAKYRFLTQPVRFIAGADGKLAAVECIELKPSELDAEGHRKLVPVEGSNFSVAADTVVLSQTAPDIEKYVIHKASDTISREGVFTSRVYGTHSDSAVAGMAGGRKTALAIDKYLKSKK